MPRITIGRKEYETVLAKTLDALTHCGKTLEDIAWIGTFDGSCVIPLPRFLAWAEKALALSDWGNDRIDRRICIVGTTDWWMTWYANDEGGWEGWQFHQMPQLAPQPFTANLKVDHTSERQPDPDEPAMPPRWRITHRGDCRTRAHLRGQRDRFKRFKAHQNRRDAARIRRNEKKYPKLAW